MSPVTYDYLAVWAIFSVPAMVVLALTLRMQIKEIARLRKQVAYLTETRQQSAPQEPDDATSEQPALELDGTQTDLDDTHQFRALAAGDHLGNDGEPDVEPPRNVSYEPKTVSVFEKIRSRR